jgi:cytochrome P450
VSPRGVRANVRALHGLTSDPCPTLDALLAEHGPTFAVGGGPLTIAVVGDPVHLASMLAMSTDNFRWGHRFNTLGFIVGPASIIVSDGAEHRRRRLAVQPAFARRRLDGCIPLMAAEADRIIDELVARRATSAGAVDLYGIGRTLVRRIVVRVLFGDDFAARADELGELLEPAMQYGVQPALRQLPHPFPSTRRAQARAALRAADAVIYEEIARRRVTAPDDDGRDVLGALIAAGDALSPQELRDQIITLIAAGYDTTASALAWTLLRAAGSADVWGRLRQEADAAFGAAAVEGFDGTTLRRLGYADAVVREALRLHPPGVFAPRQAVHDLDLAGFPITNGTMILWSPYVAGRLATVWGDPLTFRPDRFVAPDAVQAAAADGAWLPFGRGPRSCIGFALAQMELTLVAARIAQRLDVALTSPQVPKPVGMIVNRPQGGVPATVVRRAGSPTVLV